MHTYAYIKYLLFNNVKKNQLQLKFIVKGKMVTYM